MAKAEHRRDHAAIHSQCIEPGERSDPAQRDVGIESRNIRSAATDHRRRGHEIADRDTASSSPASRRRTNASSQENAIRPSSATDGISWPVPSDRNAPARSTATLQTARPGRPSTRSSPWTTRGRASQQLFQGDYPVRQFRESSTDRKAASAPWDLAASRLILQQFGERVLAADRSDIVRYPEISELHGPNRSTPDPQQGQQHRQFAARPGPDGDHQPLSRRRPAQASRKRFPARADAETRSRSSRQTAPAYSFDEKSNSFSMLTSNRV